MARKEFVSGSEFDSIRKESRKEFGKKEFRKE